MLRIYGVEEVSEREFTLMAFKYLGKDSQGVYFTDDEATFTYEEAIAAKKYMLKFTTPFITWCLKKARIRLRLTFK
jgi:hypothetical protein